MTRTELEITVRAIAGRQLTPRQLQQIMAAAVAYATSDSAGLCASRRRALADALPPAPAPDPQRTRLLALERQREGGRRGGLAKAAAAKAGAA